MAMMPSACLRAAVGTTPVRILTYGMNGAVLTESSAGTKTDYIYLDDEPVGVLQPTTSHRTKSAGRYLQADPIGLEGGKWGINPYV